MPKSELNRVVETTADIFTESGELREAHKANALKKLDISSRREIMSYAILQGWMQET